MTTIIAKTKKKTMSNDNYNQITKLNKTTT